jgi:hypothetical protein
MFNKALLLHPHVPPAGLAERFGYEELEPYYQFRDSSSRSASHPINSYQMHVDELYDNPDIGVHAPVTGSIPAATYLVPVRVYDAEPIASCQGLTVGVRKQLGKGTVYYIGTNLGAAIARGSTTARELVRTLIANSTQPEVVGHHLRPRLISSGDGALLAVFNDTARLQTDNLRLADDVWISARELDTDHVLPITENILSVEVPAHDVRVYKLAGRRNP